MLTAIKCKLFSLNISLYANFGSLCCTGEYKILMVLNVKQNCSELKEVVRNMDNGIDVSCLLQLSICIAFCMTV